MNKLVSISIVILLVLGFVKHSKGQALSLSQVEKIKSEVDSVFQEMIVLAENLDFDKLSEGVNDSHKVGFISNGKYYADYATLINDVKQTAQGISQQNISIKKKQVAVIANNIAILTASGVSSAQISEGREIAANFHWSFVYEKANNGWKVIYSHQSVSN